MENSEIIKKSKISLYISVIGFIVVFISFIAFFFNQDKLTKENTQYSEENITLKDSIKTYKSIIDSIEAKPIPVKMLTVVSDYFRYRNFRKVDSVLSIVSDTLDKYYRETSAPKSVIKDDLNRYWKNILNHNILLTRAI
jgi:hypothetical protein